MTGRRSDEIGALKVTIVSLATALAGVVLVALAATVWQHAWLGQVANALAGVLLASMLIAWLADLLLRRDFLHDIETAAASALDKHLEGLRRLEQMGVVAVFTEFPTEQVIEEFSSSTGSIRILQTWVPNFDVLESAISKATLRGAVAKALILNPESTAVRLRGRDQGFRHESAVADSIRANKHQLLHFASSLPDDHMEVREYDGLPSIQLYGGDRFIFVGFFWHGKSSTTATTLQVQVTSPFGVELVGEFERRWTTAIRCE